MRESIHLGRIAGIRVGLSWSLLPAFALIAWGLAVGQLPYEVPGYTGSAYWVVGLVSAVVFFAGLLAHEMSHAIVARRHGLEVKGIVLWLFGGVAQMEGDMTDARTELRVALVGPVTSLVIAGAGALAAWGLDASGASSIVVAAVAWLAVVNGLLGVFNLLPAFPLDGGRVLRAVLWRMWKDQGRATRAAAGSGRIVGGLLVALGVLEWLRTGVFSGLWLAAVGWFILSAANQARGAATRGAAGRGAAGEWAVPGQGFGRPRSPVFGNPVWGPPQVADTGTQLPPAELLTGLRAADAMTPDPVVVPSSETVAVAMRRLREHGAFSSLPVGDEASGRIVGLTSLSRLSAVPGDQWETTPVARASAGPADLVVAAPWESLPEVVQRMAARPDHRAMVISGGRLVGIIAPTDVIRAAARARLAGYGPQPR